MIPPWLFLWVWTEVVTLTSSLNRLPFVLILTYLLDTHCFIIQAIFVAWCWYLVFLQWSFTTCCSSTDTSPSLRYRQHIRTQPRYPIAFLLDCLPPLILPLWFTLPLDSAPQKRVSPPSHWHCASDAEIMGNVLNAADKSKDIDNESREVNFLKSKKITWKKADSASDSLINFWARQKCHWAQEVIVLNILHFSSIWKR